MGHVLTKPVIPSPTGERQVFQPAWVVSYWEPPLNETLWGQVSLCCLTRFNQPGLGSSLITSSALQVLKGTLSSTPVWLTDSLTHTQCSKLMSKILGCILPENKQEYIYGYTTLYLQFSTWRICAKGLSSPNRLMCHVLRSTRLIYPREIHRSGYPCSTYLGLGVTRSLRIVEMVNHTLVNGYL